MFENADDVKVIRVEASNSFLDFTRHQSSQIRFKHEQMPKEEMNAYPSVSFEFPAATVGGYTTQHFLTTSKLERQAFYYYVLDGKYDYDFWLYRRQSFAKPVRVEISSPNDDMPVDENILSLIKQHPQLTDEIKETYLSACSFFFRRQGAQSGLVTVLDWLRRRSIGDLGHIRRLHIETDFSELQDMSLLSGILQYICLSDPPRDLGVIPLQTKHHPPITRRAKTARGVRKVTSPCFRVTGIIGFELVLEVACTSEEKSLVDELLQENVAALCSNPSTADFLAILPYELRKMCYERRRKMWYERRGKKEMRRHGEWGRQRRPGIRICG